jgi:superoxide dismutase
LDYKPADRPKYIEAFFANIDWKMVENRIEGASANQESGQLSRAS